MGRRLFECSVRALVQFCVLRGWSRDEVVNFLASKFWDGGSSAIQPTRSRQSPFSANSTRPARSRPSSLTPAIYSRTAPIRHFERVSGTACFLHSKSMRDYLSATRRMDLYRIPSYNVALQGPHKSDLIMAGQLSLKNRGMRRLLITPLTSLTEKSAARQR